MNYSAVIFSTSWHHAWVFIGVSSSIYPAPLRISKITLRVTVQVRICAFPASQMGLQGIGISPDCNPENRASPREVSVALELMSRLISGMPMNIFVINHSSFSNGHWSQQKIMFLIGFSSLDI
jgi:hypothetical protein